ncbi:hypothetical protein ACJIZ3_006512 [Penstemon smallii]|uniref:LysM domain-containing protein n=1 Tax=Penstemon smallii TaxID=265156 RepID=A0ABD3S812_9LAMI
MANSSKKISIFLNFALVLSLLLIFNLAESKSLFDGGIFKPNSTLNCDNVVGVKSGDTCFEIAKNNKLTDTEFGAINPNLNCTALFVGQWLCINGSTN